MTESLLTTYSRVKTRLFSFILRNAFGFVGRDVRICPPFRFSNLRQVSLGDSVIIHCDSWIQVLSSKDEKIQRLIIGPYTGIGMGATISVAEKVTLEEFVLLARNVYISDNRHAFCNVTNPIMNQGIETPMPVRIGKHSWLCQNVCVLPGANIGEHCVIGANSVVRGNIPDFSVAVGCPARVVKRYNHETEKWEKV